MTLKLTNIEEDKLDEGIKPIVLFLRSKGVETFESCDGTEGHCLNQPTIRFWGDKNEGLRVTYLCLEKAIPLLEVRRVFIIEDQEIQSPFWEIIFSKGLFFNQIVKS